MKYLEYIRTKPCSNPNCHGFGQIIPHHVRMLGGAGVGMKPTDFDTIPLCFACHHEVHLTGEVTFWKLKDKQKTKDFLFEMTSNLQKEYNEK